MLRVEVPSNGKRTTLDGPSTTSAYRRLKAVEGDIMTTALLSQRESLMPPDHSLILHKLNSETFSRDFDFLDIVGIVMCLTSSKLLSLR